MNYHDYEVLAKYKRQEFEEFAKNSWILSSIKHESMLQKIGKVFIKRIKNNSTQTKDACCSTQCCIA